MTQQWHFWEFIPRIPKHQFERAYAPMSIAVLFTVAEIRSSPLLLVDPLAWTPAGHRCGTLAWLEAGWHGEDWIYDTVQKHYGFDFESQSFLLEMLQHLLD